MEYICKVIDSPYGDYVRPETKLVRCKDCKYYKVYELFGHTLPLCNRIKTMIADALEEDDYCSRAERKEE